ncbi:hypothetical protein [Streptomyces sp. NPDC057616]|uniref:hypothetical protein n=1 Tax=Streptomyces sp. NPDC057616 TaxID=3346183 RepID=UPI0036AD35C5
MSTEARHASIPPRPSKPPAAGPDQAASEPARTADDTTRSEGVWSPWRTSEPFDAFARRGPARDTRDAEEVPAERRESAAATDRGPERPQETRTQDGHPSDSRTQDGHPSDSRASDGRTSDTRTRFPSLRAPSDPPPPQASARFPDAPPSAGREERRQEPREEQRDGAGPDAPARVVPPRPAHRPGIPPHRTSAPAETTQESTRRLRPIPGQTAPVPPPPPPAREPAGPDPALSWSAPAAPAAPAAPHASGAPAPTPGSVRPVVSFGEPEGYDEQARPRPLGMRMRPRTAAVGVCLVLGLGLIGGAVTGSWLVGGGGEGGTQDTYAAAGTLWHSVPVDRLFPPTVQGTGAGPGGADRTWTRVAVAPDTGCKNAFDPLLRKALAPVGCRRLLRATYTDATQSFVTTVGLMFTKADAASMDALARRFRNEGLGTRTDLMPRPYAEKGTAAARFGPEQRASWTVSVLTDAPVVVYAVSGWADGRSVDTPVPAGQATQSGAASAPAQAGLGNEAQGLADRIERSLRKDVTSPTEKPS